MVREEEEDLLRYLLMHIENKAEDVFGEVENDRRVQQFSGELLHLTFHYSSRPSQ